jgi:hypothetical protein
MDHHALVAQEVLPVRGAVLALMAVVALGGVVATRARQPSAS